MNVSGDIIEAITTEMHGMTFVGIAVYKDGRRVDTITKEPEIDDGGFSVVLEAMVIHELGPIELRTDSEQLFRYTVTISGIYGRMVSEHELSGVYREFRPGTRSREILCEIYGLNQPEPTPEPTARIGWIGRIFNRVKEWILSIIKKQKGRFL